MFYRFTNIQKARIVKLKYNKKGIEIIRYLLLFIRQFILKRLFQSLKSTAAFHSIINQEL